MITENFYHELKNLALNLKPIPQELSEEILNSPEIDVLPLLNAAYAVRTKFVGNEITIHIINNTQNGYCPEDCHYCAQAKSSSADIEEYPIKSDQEIFAEAKNAYEKGAFRYCMVFAGRGPTKKRTEHLAHLIREIKAKYPIEICVSTGLLDDDRAKILGDAGLDRLNHNLNTSQEHYPHICTTHTYKDRLNTLQSARKAGIQLCSGIIVGMGEKSTDIIEVSQTLRSLNAESIPINFLIPIEGTTIKTESTLTPQFCLRILCLFRFQNPRAEIRVAAGREIHLRSMEVLALYAANSLFLDGYLNTKGSRRYQTLQMIKDAGFVIKSEHSLDELLAIEGEVSPASSTRDEMTRTLMKDLKDLRPHMTNQTKS
jgi:biotin synthase